MLDAAYPDLSALVRRVRGLSLDELASRAVCVDFKYFDLERLLWAVRDSPLFNSTDPAAADYAEQVRGYLATLDAFARLDLIRDEDDFVAKKLGAPHDAHPAPTGSEALDTIAECSWALWLLDRHGNVSSEEPLPGGVGDADFYVRTAVGELWVDCMSVEPDREQHHIAKYLAKKTRTKWQKKFGRRAGATHMPCAITVSLWKMQENMAPTMVRDEIVGRAYRAPDELWDSCPSLQHVWFGLPPWHRQPHRPTVIATWTRPGVAPLPSA